MKKKWEYIFYPRSVAIIGASSTPGKAGARRTASLLDGGYKGEIYFVNPRRDYIYGRKVYKSLKEIEGEVDLVLIAVSKRFLIDAVLDAAEKGAKAAVIITAGFTDATEEGRRLNKEILSIARKTGMRIIGPNCSGIFSASPKLNLLGLPPIKEGRLSVVSQSGNVIDSLVHYARLRDIGFSKIISVGNAIDLDISEYFEFLKDDPETKVILAYIEGIKNGGILIKIAREVTREKPIIAIKVGRTKAGSRAAHSHTGSMTGDDFICDEAFKQAGIIRVNAIDELFDIASMFDTDIPLPKGRGVAILSEGGGDNAIAADNVELFGLKVPTLSEETQRKLKPYLMEGVSISNPVDYGGRAEEAPHEIIPPCCRACLEDPSIDILLITGFFGGYKEIIGSYTEELEVKTANELVSLVKEYQKPIIVNTSFAREKIRSLEILRKNNIPVIESSIRTAHCIYALVKYSENKRKPIKFPILPNLRTREGEEIIRRVYDKGHVSLLETEAREFLRSCGIPMIPDYFAKNLEDAIKGAEEIGYPVALKIVSRKIQHKYDVGGVKLGIMDKNELIKAFNEIMENVKRVTKEIEGVLILPMVPPPGKVECLASVIRDKNFGTILSFGLGGVFTEVFRDISVRVLPVTEEDVDSMIKEIKAYKILKGVRGKKPKDINAIKDLLLKLSKIAEDYPEIEEIELNPFMVHEKGISIVDTLITLRRRDV